MDRFVASLGQSGRGAKQQRVGPSAQRARRMARAGFRPALEVLEDRTLMSAGALDPSFGVGGKATTAILPTFEGATAMALQTDGKIVLAGSAFGPTEQGFTPRDFAVVRLNADGSVDSSFGSNGGARINFTTLSNMGISSDDSAQAVAVQSDGKIVVAGYSDIAPPTGNSGFAVCRLNSNGSLDPGFGSGGKTTFKFGAGLDQCYGMVVQPDGKIVVVGIAFQQGTSGGSGFAVARLNSDGALDTTFAAGGKETITFATAFARASSVAVQSDGKIVVAGQAEPGGGGGALFAAARLNSDGSLDNSFGTNGERTVNFAGSGHDTAMSVALQPDGKMVLAGQVEAVGLGSSQAGIARLNSDGSLDNSFGAGGEVTFNFSAGGGAGDFESASGVLVQANSQIVVAGTAYQPDLRSAVFGLARLNSDGALDTTFAAGGKETTSFGGEAFARGAALQPDGNIVVAGGWQPGDVFSTQWAAARYLGGPPPAPATLTVVAGNNQSALINTAFAAPLVALVTDAFGNPVPGVSVTFAAPSSGAGASFTPGPTVTTNAAGEVSVSATANGTGGTFAVTATAAGVAAPASFTLTNTAPPKVITVGVFDPSTATWYLRSSASAGPPDAGRFQYGPGGSIPVTGDWDGRGSGGIGAFDPATATWYLRFQAGAGSPDAGTFLYGGVGWLPVTGDWNNSGHTGIGAFDPATATWYLHNDPDAGPPDAGQFQFGVAGGVPVVGDWTGTGHLGIGIFDPATFTWYLRSSATPGAPDVGVFRFGGIGWLPVAGDWAGTGHAGVGAFDPATATWYLRSEDSAGAPDAGQFAYGGAGWLPITGPFGSSGGAGASPLAAEQLSSVVAALLAGQKHGAP